MTGGSLLYRGLSGHCHLFKAVGVNTAEGEGASDEATEVVAAITICGPAEDVDRLWRDPRVLGRVMGHFVEIEAAEGGRTRGTLSTPIGGDQSWATRIAEDRPGDTLRWESVDGSGLRTEGTVRFRPALADLGTEVTLHVRFDPPSGLEGVAAAKVLGFVPRLVASQALRRLKSLIETGEILNTADQPAARADTR